MTAGHSPQSPDQVCQPVQDEQGNLFYRPQTTEFMGIAAVVEARRRIMRGENPQEVIQDVTNKFGESGAMTELAGHVVLDPLNIVMPYAGKIPSLIGRAIGDDALKHAYSTWHRPVEGFQKYKESIRSGMAGTVDELSNFQKSVGGLNEQGEIAKYTAQPWGTNPFINSIYNFIGHTPAAGARGYANLVANNISTLADVNKRWGAELPAYNQFVGRCSLLLQEGRHVADIGMLYPVVALQAAYQFDVPGARQPNWGKDVPRWADYLKISDRLTSSVRRDFTFLHPEVLDDRCRVQDATLRLNNATNWEEYRVIIIPGGEVISWSNLQKIRKFYDNGGRVIATTQLPFISSEFGHDDDGAPHILIVAELAGLERQLGGGKDATAVVIEHLDRLQVAPRNDFAAP